MTPLHYDLRPRDGAGVRASTCCPVVFAFSCSQEDPKTCVRTCPCALRYANRLKCRFSGHESASCRTRCRTRRMGPRPCLRGFYPGVHAATFHSGVCVDGPCLRPDSNRRSPAPEAGALSSGPRRRVLYRTGNRSRPCTTVPGFQPLPAESRTPLDCKQEKCAHWPTNGGWVDLRYGGVAPARASDYRKSGHTKTWDSPSLRPAIMNVTSAEGRPATYSDDRSSAFDWIRTSDHTLRRRMLCPLSYEGSAG